MAPSIARFLPAFLAAFLFAWPAFGASYYVDADAAGGGDGSSGTPWNSIAQVNAGTFTDDDFIYIDCGDTLTDAELQLGQSGSDGSPITVQGGWDTGGTACTGSNYPILGSAADKCIDVPTDWLEFHDLDCSGGNGPDAGDNIIEVDGDNNLFDNITVTGDGGGAANCFVIADGADNGTITTLTLDECDTAGLFWGAGHNWTVTDLTVLDTGVTGQGDAFAVGNNTYTDGNANNTVTNFTCNDPTTGENCIDIKSGAGWVLSSVALTDCTQDCILIHDGNATGSTTGVTIQDSTLAPPAGIARIGQIGTGATDASVLTFKRVILDCSDVSSNCWRMDGAAANPVTLNFEESVLYWDAGSTVTEGIAFRESATGNFVNTTIISLNGNTAAELIDGDNADFSGTLTFKNTIFYTTCTTCLLVETGAGGATETFDKNLYESANAGDWIDLDAGTGYNEGEITSTLDTDGATGDPTFANTTPGSNIFAMLEPGSPGIGLGAAANLSDGAGTTDLLGYPFNATTPNAGARSQRIQIRGDKDKPDKGTKTAMACECAVDDIRNSRFILACECVQ